MDFDKFRGTLKIAFDSMFQDMNKEVFDTPLANSELGLKATLKPGAGTAMEFRSFSEIAPSKTSAANHAPTEYGMRDDSVAELAYTDDVYQISPSRISGYIKMYPNEGDQDPVNFQLMNAEKLTTWVHRMLHRLVNNRFLVAPAQAITNLKDEAIAGPGVFKTIFAGGKLFNTMDSGSFISITDIQRAVSILKNGKARMLKDGRYACVIDMAGIQQLAFGDSAFRDVLKRFEDKSQKVFGAGEMVDFAGVRFIIQDDAYRCKLASQGGSLAARQDDGIVRVCHILGASSFGYLDFGGKNSAQRRSLTPTLTIKDQTITGVMATVAVSMFAQAMVLNTKWGLNLAYTSAFDESSDDIAE